MEINKIEIDKDLELIVNRLISRGATIQEDKCLRAGFRLNLGLFLKGIKAISVYKGLIKSEPRFKTPTPFQKQAKLPKPCDCNRPYIILIKSSL